MISYTTPYRIYFDNLSVSFVDNEITNPQHYTQRQLDAIRLYMLELYTESHQNVQWITYVSYIQNQIVPMLEKNNVEVKGALNIARGFLAAAFIGKKLPILNEDELERLFTTPDIDTLI